MKKFRIIGVGEFDTQNEMLDALKQNKDVLLAAKKSEIKTKQQPVNFIGFFNPKEGAVKELPNMEDGYIYPVISTTNYMDSHGDVHLSGSMTKTAKEQSRKVYYVADHQLKIDSIIATPKNVEAFIQKVKWSDIGQNFEGETEVLVFKIAKDQIKHAKFKELIEEGEKFQNSIRMQYVKLELAVNSDEKDLKAQKAVWDKYIDQVANREKAEEMGYFWAVGELKLYQEGSAVLFGSNDSTTIESKNISAVDDTEGNGTPPNGTDQNKVTKNMYLLLTK